jgi:tetratricopeptide (TPR) repeat protein
LVIPTLNIKKADKARRMYQGVIDHFVQNKPADWPGYEKSIWAKSGIILADIAEKQLDKADEDFEEFKSLYKDHPDMAKNAIMIADKSLHEFNNPQKAQQFYTYILSELAKDKPADWAGNEQLFMVRSGLIQADIDAKQFDKADEDFEEFKNLYKDHPDMAKQVISIAERYFYNWHRTDKVRELCEYYLNDLSANRDDNWPGKDQLIWAKSGILISDIANGKNIDNDLNSLIEEFNGNSGLPRAVFMVGEENWFLAAIERKKEHTKSETNDRNSIPKLNDAAKSYLAKACIICERIINELPETDFTAQAYNRAARCYSRMGQYDKAIEYYKTVVNNFPDSQYGSDAQFQIVQLYKKFIITGDMALPDAMDTMAVECERQIETYPDSFAAGVASKWLSYANRSKKENIDENTRTPQIILDENTGKEAKND